MAKKLTSWRRQGQSAPTVDYDSSSVDYDSDTTPYAGSGEQANSVIKPRTAWNKVAKVLTKFIKNPASDTNATAYDTSTVYDSSLTYDSIVSGESKSTTKKPTNWRTA